MSARHWRLEKEYQVDCVCPGRYPLTALDVVLVLGPGVGRGPGDAVTTGALEGRGLRPVAVTCRRMSTGRCRRKWEALTGAPLVVAELVVARGGAAVLTRQGSRRLGTDRDGCKDEWSTDLHFLAKLSSCRETPWPLHQVQDSLYIAREH